MRFNAVSRVPLRYLIATGIFLGVSGVRWTGLVCKTYSLRDSLCSIACTSFTSSLSFPTVIRIILLYLSEILGSKRPSILCTVAIVFCPESLSTGGRYETSSESLRFLQQQPINCLQVFGMKDQFQVYHNQTMHSIRCNYHPWKAITIPWWALWWLIPIKLTLTYTSIWTVLILMASTGNKSFLSPIHCLELVWWILKELGHDSSQVVEHMLRVAHISSSEAMTIPPWRIRTNDKLRTADNDLPLVSIIFRISSFNSS